MIFGYFTLLVALIISAVAEFYSIVGLMAIFAAAPMAVAIMGAALGVGKITGAVWLKLNWARAPWTYKAYLIPAVAMLMVLTSMGIFGFLSKAHSDQSLVSGDVQSKIAVYDEKIKTAKDNIDANRKALKQMDEAVDQVMGRSSDEKGADKAVAIRKGQQKERARLLSEIAAEQKTISQINEERAPIAAEVRKVEAEVGPIKYIAALIYGDSTDTNILEAAVRWVIILIVAVFDPLALVLILSAQQTLRWSKEEQQAEKTTLQEEQGSNSAEPNNVLSDDLPPAPPVESVGIAAQEIAKVIPEAVAEPSILEQHPYLNQPFSHFSNLKPMVYKEIEAKLPEDPAPVGWMYKETPSIKTKKKRSYTKKAVPEFVSPNAPGLDASSERPGDYLSLPTELPYQDLGNGYVIVEGKQISFEALQGIYPRIWSEIQRKKINNQLKPIADDVNVTSRQSHTTFGTEFPQDPNKGEMFLNVSTLPSKLFKFNGQRWIAVDKSIADSYTYNEDYLKYLVNRIDQGLLSLDDLTDSEQDQIAEYLKNNVK